MESVTLRACVLLQGEESMREEWEKDRSLQPSLVQRNQGGGPSLWTDLLRGALRSGLQRRKLTSSFVHCVLCPTSL